MYPKLDKLDAWQEQREVVVACIYSLAQHLDDFHDKKTKGKLVSSVIGVSGTAIGLAGILMAPITGGASLAPAIAVSGGSGAVSIATSIASKVADRKKVSKVIGSVDELLETDKKYTDEIEAIAIRLDEAESNLEKGLMNLIAADLQDGTADGNEKFEAASKKKDECSVVQLYGRDCSPTSIGKEIEMLKQLFPTPLPGILKKGVSMLRSSNLMSVRKLLKVGQDFAKGGAKAGKRSLGALRFGKAVKIGGIVVAAALLPFEIHELIKNARDLKNKKGHKSSDELCTQAKKLRDGIDDVREKMLGKVLAMNNLILLVNYIKQNGVSEKLDEFIDKVLEILLPVQDLIKAFDKLQHDSDGKKNTFTRDEEDITGVLINAAEVKDSFFHDLAVTIWTAWKLKRKSFAFLQNTSSTSAAALWTLFGVLANSFGADSAGGVSILLPLHFDGDIISQHEFQSSTTDWNGRCLVLNVSLGDAQYALVNLLAPEGQHDRALFLKETTKFIRTVAEGPIVLASNIQREVQSMTVEAKKKKVCPNVPWPLMEKFVPYRVVSEYLLHFHGYEADEPNMTVFEISKSFVCGDPHEVFINWAGCDKPVMSVEDYSKQVDPVLKLGLTDTWKTMNPQTSEFTTETRMDRKTLCCSKGLEFFISDVLASNMKSCSISHDLRFLGFLKESVLLFHCGGIQT